MARVMAYGDPGIDDLQHPKHSDSDQQRASVKTGPGHRNAASKSNNVKDQWGHGRNICAFGDPSQWLLYFSNRFPDAGKQLVSVGVWATARTH
jgi:hypothetical protein